jgi:hypothetical protein
VLQVIHIKRDWNAKIPGGYREVETPVPIPNTEVKHFIVNGTMWFAAWESRTPPGYFFVIINKNPSHFCNSKMVRDFFLGLGWGKVFFCASHKAWGIFFGERS